MPFNIWQGSAGAPVLTYNLDTDRRDYDISPYINQLVADETPFLGILNHVGRESADTTEFMWYDSEPGGWWATVTGAHDNEVVEIEVSSSIVFKPKDIVKNTRTGEIMQVTSIISPTRIGVMRGAGLEISQVNVVIGGTASAAMQDGDNLLRLGNALMENDVPAESRANQPIKEYNYIQDFSDTIDGSDTMENEKKRTTPGERARLRQEAFMKHRLDIARAIMFGERREILPINTRMTGGLLQFIKSNSYDAGGLLTEPKFEEFCEMLFQYSKKPKLFLCAPRVGSTINEFAKAKMGTTTETTVYGIRVTEYKSFHGRLYIASSQIFERDYAAMGVGITVDNIKLKIFAGNFAKLRANIQAERQHGWEDEIYSQVGLMTRLEKTHGILANAVEAA